MGPCMHPQQHAPCMHTHTKTHTHTHADRSVCLSICPSIIGPLCLSTYLSICSFIPIYHFRVCMVTRGPKKSTRLPAAEGQRAVAVASGAPGIRGLPFSMYLGPKGFIQFRLMCFVRFIVCGLGLWFWTSASVSCLV